ncbi:hypothetical protein SDC9_161951 [bioreactor metagenome]|uniref:4Fe-4S ferredoxin-type domain-containing protein n=1 Tax=bioreactor metagenome TaxID=1076179 RepID=A0A645FQY1_9ZZZZ
MMDQQLIIDETLCKSCQYCVAAYPKNALSIGKLSPARLRIHHCEIEAINPDWVIMPIPAPLVVMLMLWPRPCRQILSMLLKNPNRSGRDRGRRVDCQI